MFNLLRKAGRVVSYPFRVLVGKVIKRFSILK